MLALPSLYKHDNTYSDVLNIHEVFLLFSVACLCIIQGLKTRICTDHLYMHKQSFEFVFVQPLVVGLCDHDSKSQISKPRTTPISTSIILKTKTERGRKNENRLRFGIAIRQPWRGGVYESRATKEVGLRPSSSSTHHQSHRSTQIRH